MRLIQQKISTKERKKKQDAEMAGRAELVYRVDLTPVRARASISQIIQASKQAKRKIPNNTL